MATHYPIKIIDFLESLSGYVVALKRNYVPADRSQFSSLPAKRALKRNNVPADRSQFSSLPPVQPKRSIFQLLQNIIYSKIAPCSRSTKLRR
ncbi:hypothetical protein LAY57_32275 [Argonema antarcticum A004/B2]|nr:hypothetical protein [Argonema antarcticum A004/B2]